MSPLIYCLSKVSYQVPLNCLFVFHRFFCGCCEYFNDIYKIIYILIIWENPVHAITIYSCKWWFIEFVYLKGSVRSVR